MRISFALTKEYEIFIDKEEIDKKYSGDTQEAVKNKLKEAEEVDSYVNDIEILEEEFEYQDTLYDEALEEFYEEERRIAMSMVYADLIQEF